MTTSSPKRVIVRPAQADATPTRWADPNTVTFTGRVHHAEVVKGRYGDFLSLDIITRPIQDDDDSSLVIHVSSSQLVRFYEAGGIPTGRTATITGVLQRLETTYEKDGKTVPLKRPRMVLGDSFVQWGPKPSKR